MPSTVTPVLTLKEYVQCAVSKSLIPSFINKAMYDLGKMVVFYFILCLLLANVITTTCIKKNLASIICN
ncbi:Cysteine-rich PDZ-binding protein [Actinidia chinensis var. chinensis]|uniref:Cysteine-rich PDZ-binding protein n=1 Tax=Actinidia chinensis var. chinensis TaxID=1590841 RepID=A0A2R6PY11_ACTCC|nr:Cysteine-rich PDZ-binding protein [Actinidia chinensis var. chinensis]